MLQSMALVRVGPDLGIEQQQQEPSFRLGRIYRHEESDMIPCAHVITEKRKVRLPDNPSRLNYHFTTYQKVFFWGLKWTDFS